MRNIMHTSRKLDQRERVRVALLGMCSGSSIYAALSTTSTYLAVSYLGFLAIAVVVATIASTRRSGATKGRTCSETNGDEVGRSGYP